MHADTEDDSARWRDKYYGSLEDLEQKEARWAAAEDLLYQNLGRLALAVYGVDRTLDRRLDAVRNAVRSRRAGDHIAEEIARVHEAAGDIEKTGDRHGAPWDASGFFARLYDHLPFPEPVAAEVQALKAELGRIDGNFQPIADETARLLSKVFAAGPATPETGGDEGQPPPQSQGPNLHEVLGDLLVRLDFPDDLGTRIADLKSKLNGPITDSALPSILEAFATLVKETHRRVRAQREEMQRFLHRVTDRLQELDGYLADAQTSGSASRRERSKLKDSLYTEVRGIQSDLRDAPDLEQLQTAVQERLTAIERHVETYVQVEDQRSQTAEDQIRQLSDRVRDMEAETTQLRQELREKLDQSQRDALTGVFNRAALEKRLAEEEARWHRYHQPLSVAFWDVDRFKCINDTYGHEAGDRVLQAVSSLIQRQVRETDFVARYGGEEFILLMPATAVDVAYEVAEKLRVALEGARFRYRGKRVRVTASCGIATFTDGQDAACVLRRADDALYRAKQAGRNRCQVASG